MSSYVNIPQWADAYFDALAKYGSQEAARRAAKVKSPSTISNWKKNNEEFMKRHEEALIRHTEILEAELTRRAVYGREEPVIYRGQIQYQRNPQTGQLVRDEEGQPVPVTVTRYSDQLLLAKLRAELPHKYGGAEAAAIAAMRADAEERGKADLTKEELKEKILRLREGARSLPGPDVKVLEPVKSGQSS